MHKHLRIDIWDADTMMCLGHTSLPLRAFLRQGQQQATSSLEIPVFESVPRTGSLRDNASFRTTASSLRVTSQRNANAFHSDSDEESEEDDNNQLGSLLVQCQAFALERTSQQELELGTKLLQTIPGFHKPAVRLAATPFTLLADEKAFAKTNPTSLGVVPNSLASSICL